MSETIYLFPFLMDRDVRQRALTRSLMMKDDIGMILSVLMRFLVFVLLVLRSPSLSLYLRGQGQDTRPADPATDL